MKLISRKNELHLILSSAWLILLFCSAICAAEISKESVQKTALEAKESSEEWSGDTYRRSILLFIKASKDWKTLGEFRESSKCLRESAKVYLKLSDFDAASNTLTEAVKIDSQFGEWEAKIEDLSLLSLVYLRAGKLKGSEQAFKQALQLSQSSKNSFIRATALFSAAQYSYSYGNTEETIKLFQETLIFADKTDDKNLVAQSLLYLGFTYIKNGNPTMSLENAQKALAKSEETNDKRGQAICYIGLGFIYTILNEKQDALNAYKKGETLFPDDFEWLEKGKLFNGLATVYEEYKQLKLAEAYRRKALKCYQKSKYLYGQLATLPTLANVVYKNGDTVSANKFYEEALELAYKLNDDYHLAYIKKDLGEINLENGLTDDAIKNFLEVEKIYLKLNAKFPEVQESLGEAYKKNGNSNLARTFFKKALQISNETKDILVESETLHNLAKLDAIENKTDEALRNIKNSLNITETIYSDVVNSNLKRTYLSSVFDRYELYINLLMQKHKHSPDENFAIQALQASEKSRSRSLLETLRSSEANFTKDAAPELVQKEKEIMNLLSIKADKLTAFLSSNADKSETDILDNEINSLQNELEEIKGRLKADSPAYSAIKNPPPFDVAEFQQNVLDDKTVLLEFSLGEKESYLWLVGKTEISYIVLPPQDELENRIEKIRQTFDARQMLQDEDVENYRNRTADAEDVFNRETKLLSDELFGQIADKLIDKRLIIVPDGKLTLLPISALPFPNSDEPFILRNEVVYQPSASLLNILPKIQNRNHQPDKDLLVFADPVFNDSDIRLTGKTVDDSFVSSILNLRDFRLTDANGKIPRLFATQQEADSIAEAVGKSRTEIVSGFAANRDKVLNSAISDYRILHFATHGLIDVERPEISSIVLAQFDENGQKREGFLRLQDIYALDLSSDLVVLSACQSGVGKEIKGEGMMSLNNAFLQAGAKSVLSSSWKVDDDATAEFMKRFYTNLVSEQLTPAAALRQTQIEMMQTTQFKSPFYWAAFTVQGEFRQPISISQSYFYRIFFGVLGIVGVGVLWRFKFFKIYSTAKK